MAERLKIRFLMVVWGARYIEEFARVSLPSYLAPGNLPALASHTDLEVLIMTSRESVVEFEAEHTVRVLRRLCTVRYVFIDDLITTGCYGVTLTLAYARGIGDSGAAQTDTTFVFMNSDFVLADGALTTLLARLRAGHRCVMAPSLRARAEHALPVLAAAVDPRTGVLAMPPRAMVQIAFDTLHPTVIAKTVSQRFITCATHNQIYWQVDGTALLARHHLIFMLAIRPEVPIGAVNSYCDYGFVPELVPSGQFTILGDSDEFFMLELQPTAQERLFLSCGVKTPAQIAREVSVWTTAGHRRFAEVDVLFRTGELPVGLTEARRSLAAFVAEVQAHLPRQAKDHVDHPYWVLGVAAWRSLRDAGGPAQSLPPELGEPGDRWYFFARRMLEGTLGSSVRRRYIALLARMRGVAGTVPDVPLWHPLWNDSRLLRDWLLTLRPGGRRLLVCPSDSSLATALSRGGLFEVRRGLGAFVAANTGSASQPAGGAARYEMVLLHVHRAEVKMTARLLDAARPLLEPGGTLAVYVDHPGGELDSSNLSIELAQYIEHLLSSDWLCRRVSARFAGGRIKRWLCQLERRLRSQLWASSGRRLPLLLGAMALWPIVAALTAANNLRMGRPTEICPAYCSSAMIVLSDLDVAPAVTVAAEQLREAPAGSRRVVGPRAAMRSGSPRSRPYRHDVPQAGSSAP